MFARFRQAQLLRLLIFLVGMVIFMPTTASAIEIIKPADFKYRITYMPYSSGGKYIIINFSTTTAYITRFADSGFRRVLDTKGGSRFYAVGTKCAGYHMLRVGSGYMTFWVDPSEVSHPSSCGAKPTKASAPPSPPAPITTGDWMHPIPIAKPVGGSSSSSTKPPKPKPKPVAPVIVAPDPNKIKTSVRREYSVRCSSTTLNMTNSCSDMSKLLAKCSYAFKESDKSRYDKFNQQFANGGSAGSTGVTPNDFGANNRQVPFYRLSNFYDVPKSIHYPNGSNDFGSIQGGGASVNPDGCNGYWMYYDNNGVAHIPTPNEYNDVFVPDAYKPIYTRDNLVCDQGYYLSGTDCRKDGPMTSDTWDIGEENKGFPVNPDDYEENPKYNACFEVNNDPECMHHMEEGEPDFVLKPEDATNKDDDDSPIDGGNNGGTCDLCKIFECPGMDDFFDKSKTVLGDTMSDIVGDFKVPPIPDLPRPQAKNIFDVINDIERKTLPKPTGEIDNNFEDNSFDANDLKQGDPIPFEDDPHGGYPIQDPYSGLDDGIGAPIPDQENNPPIPDQENNPPLPNQKGRPPLPTTSKEGWGGVIDL